MSKNKRTEGVDESRYRMRKGMAKTALRMRDGQAIIGSNEQPLKFAKRMADGGVSNAKLEKWSRGKGRKTYISMS